MHTVNTCQWAKERLRALGELRLQITVQHNSRFLSLVRCLGSVWPNPVVHVAWRSAPCDGVPLPVSPGWQIISASGDGFWSRPRSPWIPLSQLIPLRRRLREKCKRERRALTPCIHFSAATRAEAVTPCTRLHLSVPMSCFTQHSFVKNILNISLKPPDEGSKSIWHRVECLKTTLIFYAQMQLRMKWNRYICGCGWWFFLCVAFSRNAESLAGGEERWLQTSSGSL